MKRTPPWVFIAAAGLQLAALTLCVWAMEQWRRAEQAEPEATPAPAPAPASSFTAAEVTYAREPAPQPPPAAATPVSPPAPPAAPPPPPAPRPAPPPPPAGRVTVAGTPVDRSAYSMPAPAREAVRPATQTVEPPPLRPLFGPPPERAEHDFGSNGLAEPAIPRFITEVADDTTQLVTGTIRERAVTFGFYPDGNIRFVDVDGGRYGGKAESARARMREVDGLRAFTVQIGVALDGRLQATFTGGLHDAATYPLEPLVGWGVA